MTMKPSSRNPQIVRPSAHIGDDSIIRPADDGDIENFGGSD
jgi:hypothetical protein